MKTYTLIYIFLIAFTYSCQENNNKHNSNTKLVNETIDTVKGNNQNQKNVIINQISEQNLYDKDSCKCCLESYLQEKHPIIIYNDTFGTAIDTIHLMYDSTYEEEQTIIFKNAYRGWFQIDTLYCGISPNNFSNKWITSENIVIGTSNYDSSTVKIYSKPDENADSVGYFNWELYTYPIDCDKEWVLITIDSIEGWLSPNNQCNNPYTNCN